MSEKNTSIFQRNLCVFSVSLFLLSLGGCKCDCGLGSGHDVKKIREAISEIKSAAEEHKSEMQEHFDKETPDSKEPDPREASAPTDTDPESDFFDDMEADFELPPADISGQDEEADSELDYDPEEMEDQGLPEEDEKDKKDEKVETETKTAPPAKAPASRRTTDRKSVRDALQKGRDTGTPSRPTAPRRPVAPRDRDSSDDAGNRRPVPQRR